MDNKEENNNLKENTNEVIPVVTVNPVEQSVVKSVEQAVQQVPSQAVPVTSEPQTPVTTNNIQPEAVTVETSNVVAETKPVKPVAVGPVTPQPVVQNTVNPVPQQSTTPKASEPEKEVKPSKFKIFLLIVLFAILGSLIYFLPDISHYMKNRDNSEATVEKEIPTGVMTCKYTKKGKDSTIMVETAFNYTDNQLKSSTTINKVSSEDAETLEKHSNRCELLKEFTKDVDGTEVTCSVEDKTVTINQDILYSTIDIDELNAAYTESGGTYPEFDLNEKIDSVESTMIASGYKCEKK